MQESYIAELWHSLNWSALPLWLLLTVGALAAMFIVLASLTIAYPKNVGEFFDSQW
jgi:hypothetical protein